jgi:hypothetical protein
MSAWWVKFETGPIALDAAAQARPIVWCKTAIEGAGLQR